MLSWNAPVTFPSKFPLRMNEPVSDPPDEKQGVAVVKLRLVTLTAVPLSWVREVVKANVGPPLGSDNAAVQLPFTLFVVLLELPLPPPHAPSISPSTRSIAILNCFMSIPY